ncbi:MAG TPA: S8 family serine peptidase [Edaphocola sp.]|nr:S8 family serine peptidase [Edaphocola sp.]
MKKTYPKPINKKGNSCLFLEIGRNIMLGFILLLAWDVSGQKQFEKFSENASSNTEDFSPTYYPGQDQTDVIYLNATHIKLGEPGVISKKIKQSLNFNDKKMFLVKFAGPIQNKWYQMLTNAGAQIVDYIPNYAYLVYSDQSSINQIIQQSTIKESPIKWIGAYISEYKIAPQVYQKNANGNIIWNALGHEAFEVQLVKDDAANSNTLSLLNRIKKKGTSIEQQGIAHYVNLVVSLDLHALKELAAQNDVISIQPYIAPTKNDEKQAIIMTGNLNGNIPNPSNYLTYLASHGFTQAQFDASGFVVNVTDDGLDAGSVGGVMNTMRHFGLYKSGNTALTSRVAFIQKTGTATDADTKGCAGHGNINTHIIGGFVPDALLLNANHHDVDGYRYGLGIAPFVKLGNSTMFKIDGSSAGPNFSNLEAYSYQNGGRISSNSWGAPVNGSYTATAQTYDYLVRDAQLSSSTYPLSGNQEMVIVFSAGNSGSGTGTIGSPGSSKNVITVGATEGVNLFNGADGCGIDNNGADNANDVISFSSRGPCTDGRIKPDIMTVGTHVIGGVFPSSISNPLTGSGTADACFDGTGVCGGISGSTFWPSNGQEWYTASSGTSHSCPAIAGFAALVRQNFINKGLNPPSPAMTKAVMLNTTAYMTGVGANDNLYSKNQGMGRVSMDNYFQMMDNPNELRDQLTQDIFTASGQELVKTFYVDNTSIPVRITLAYTDAPGSTTGNAYVNNLDLEVTVNGITYKGNVFTGSLSITGGVADVKNNVESVFLPAGTSGTISIKIKATNIAGDGVPGNGYALDQDFALAVSNVGLIMPPPCAGTPNAGTVSVPHTVSPNSPYTVISSGYSNNVNLEFQWQSQTNNGSWVNQGAASNYFQAYAATSTGVAGDVIRWKLKVTCLTSGISVFSTIDSATIVLNYCTVSFPNGVEPITLVNFEGINNSSSATINGTPPLEDFKSLVANVTQGSTYPITVKGNTDGNYTNKITVFIDWNQDGTFDPINEKYFIGDIVNSTGLDTKMANGNITIPNSSLIGITRMRVMKKYSTEATPCNANGWGQAEDYTLNVSAPAPIHLEYFKGYSQKTKNYLNWKSGIEKNADKYILERSSNGKDFKMILSVNAKNKNGTSYQYIDELPLEGDNFYRLRLESFDDKSTYSSIVKLNNSINQNFVLTAIPNPVNSHLNVNIQGQLSENGIVTLVDVIGRVLYKKKVTQSEFGINMEAFNNGVYLLQYQDGIIKQSIKIVKQ